jgi:hypothetical protein
MGIAMQNAMVLALLALKWSMGEIGQGESPADSAIDPAPRFAFQR